VLSFQWKPAPDTVGAMKSYLGPARYATVEPQALLLNAGARGPTAAIGRLIRSTSGPRSRSA
jgi:hypothetical protein